MPDETPIPEGSMPNETTALDILQRQVESLITQLEKITGERDEFRDALKTISIERDDLQARVTAPDAKAAALKHLWQVSGYKAEADEPDEKALGKLVEDLRKSADYAFEPSDNADFGMRNAESKIQNRQSSRTKYGLETGAAPEPAGGGRSTERNKGGDGTIVTAEMRADPRFMLDPRNREIITAAAKEGRFR